MNWKRRRSKVKSNEKVGTNCLTVRNLLEDLNKVKDKARFLSSRKKYPYPLYFEYGLVFYTYFSSLKDQFGTGSI